MASEEKEKAPRRERSSLAAFLGMVMSALVSLFIAGTMFTVGAIHRRMADNRARRALIHFLSVEAGDIHAESCKSAYGLFVGNRHREVAALQMAGARSLDKALALDADPKLVATLRSIYGRLNRLTRDLKSASEFYRERKKLTQGQIGMAIDECSGMGRELTTVLKIATEEGVDGSALAELEKARAEAAKLTEALVAHKEKLLPDVKLGVDSIDIGTMLGHVAPAIRISNYSSGPVTIKVRSTWKEVRLVMQDEVAKKMLGEAESYEIKPDESIKCQVWMASLKEVLPAGPFEGAVIVETDCPGYEKLTVPVKGVLEMVKSFPRYFTSINLNREQALKLNLQNYSDRPVTIGKTTCSIAGVEVTFPKGKTIEPKKRLEVHVRIPLGILPVGDFEGEIVMQTDYPRHLPVKVPLKGKVPKQ